MESVYEKLSVWRLITSFFAFSSTPELIFGAVLLYYFRVFERQIGSNKYAVFIIFSTMVSVLLQILALGYMKDPSLNPLTSGPYGLIFASYVPFFFDIPISMKFRIFGLSFSDKSFVYLAGLQLLFSSGRRSIVPGLSGILAGLLYRLNTFGVRRLKVTLSRPFGKRDECNPYQGLPITENDGSIPSHQARQIEASAVDARTATQDPTESSIAALVSMGFDRSAAIQALALTNYDVNLASNILLEAQALQQ
ncbi:Rhomboid-like protein 20 [Zea mays]|uniref:Rhomboid-like protein 20 n=1 Tax=Zea mays TaxID=4577 RepID=A0A3L6FFJ0_MAIZE|nr:Rhomboid-like protein 20 [Zea mays]